MLTRLRARIGSAHVIATIALFFAIAGGSAIALKGKNSVDSGDLKKNAVHTSDIQKNAVTSAKIKDGTVGSADVKDESVGEADLQDPEPVHLVGTPGQPAFANGGENDCIWSAVAEALPGVPTYPVGFFRGSDGMVYLTGVVQRQAGPGGDMACNDFADLTVYTLPPGYRPDQTIFLSGNYNGAASTVFLVIGKNGATTIPPASPHQIPPGTILYAGAPDNFGFDGIVFRGEGSGSGVARHGAPDRISAAAAARIGLQLP
jgi:hypothetical protein